MLITVNGEPFETDADNLTALVEALGLDIRKVAVERNMVLTPRSLHAETTIEAGDRIEIVQFVGGG